MTTNTHTHCPTCGSDHRYYHCGTLCTANQHVATCLQCKNVYLTNQPKPPEQPEPTKQPIPTTFPTTRHA